MSEENYERMLETIYAIKATLDDVDSVTVLIDKALTDQQGEIMPEVGMVLNYCSGGHAFLSRNVATRLLNDGVLTRMRIPHEFV